MFGAAKLACLFSVNDLSRVVAEGLVPRWC